MKTFFDPVDRQEVLDRLRRLRPEAVRRWGRMSAPQMVAHLTDQMSHCLGDQKAAPIPGPLRWPGIRFLVPYVLPWPRGRVNGPPEAFVTEPVEWSTDLQRLIASVERFGASDPGAIWPDHALFGRMSGADWGFFCWKHFHHHLTQFGV